MPIIYLPRWLQKILPRFFQYLILSIVVVVIFVPIVILLFGSVKTTGEMYSHPYTIPNPPHWENLLGDIEHASVLEHVTKQFGCHGRDHGRCGLCLWSGGFCFCTPGFPRQGLAFQPVHPGSYVPHQRCHFACLFRAAPNE